jgi:prephenate dehydrogenase
MATSIIGYGHFGQALAGLLRDAGMSVRAWDPHVAVPDDVGAADAAAATRAADVVVLAVPIPQIHPALVELRPHLDPETLVIDVGSVKTAPIAAMAEVLGTDIAWAGTHPLFGSSSIALGERPLRTVVCPNELHPHGADRARAWYEAFGCEVINQSPGEHDRVMARTHAMAFFIAKGLIDVGAAEGLTFSPPSFRALAQTIDTVRSDAGHLFLAIERDNPYAAEARQALLDALGEVHARLEGDEEAWDEIAAFDIPDLGAQAPELRETRDLIDELDTEIVRLLARRSQLSRRAGRIKSEHGHGVRDPSREEALLGDRRRWAAQHGLPEQAIADVFTAILRLSRRLQSERPE